MANATTPRLYDNVQLFTQAKHEDMLNNNYVVVKSSVCVYRGDVGKLIKYQYPISGCERAARLVACVAVTPFSCILTTLTCGQCQATFIPCLGHLVGVPLDGGYLENAFVKDQEQSVELRNQDFQALGYDSSENENIAELVKSEKFLVFQSEKSREHYYMPFYGPVSNWSYIVVIPNGKLEDLQFHTVFGNANKPLSKRGIKIRGETLCRTYRPKVGQVQDVAANVVAQSRNTYGSISGQEEQTLLQ